MTSRTELAAKHRPNGAHWPECVFCEEDWPCSVTALLADIERLEGAALQAYERWAHYFEADHRQDFWPGLCLAMDELGAVLHPERADALATGASVPAVPADSGEKP